jgi:LysM repeat protein
MNAKLLSTTFCKLLIATALLFSALAFAKPAQAESACQSPVSVVSGDTLLKIATRCGTTVSALLLANPEIKDRNVIYAGQKIVLPGALLPGTGSTDIYVIKRGDTLSSIARTFNTTIDKLLELNKDITNPSRIYEGQRLQVPKSGTPAPAPTLGQTYIVQRGDTLRIIPLASAPGRCCSAQPTIADPNKIVGQKLVLPASVKFTVVSTTSHHRKSLTHQCGCQPIQHQDADIIYIGQVLRIK